MIYSPWDCKKQSVNDIRRIGKELLKLDMKGKKADLCKRIDHQLNPPPKPVKKAMVPKGPGDIMKKKFMRMRY